MSKALTKEEEASELAALEAEIAQLAADELAAKQADEAEKSSASKVATVYGDMVHPFTSVRHTQDPVHAEIDGWVQSQIDAGKMVLVTD